MEQLRAYDHRFHAGNVGDVWKHAAMLAWLEAGRDGPPRTLIETHGGAGMYALGPTGEWTEGIGRVLTKDAGAPPAVAKLVHQVRAAGARRYPGSPVLARSTLRADDRYIAHEIAPEPLASLERAVGGDARVTVVGVDGLAALAPALETLRDREVWILIDPPYADRSEWSLVPAAIGRALAVHPRARLMLWYPVKSLARPNAMFLELATHTEGVALELLTSPLTFKKNRLNGSGLMLARAPDGVIEQLAAISAWLGPRMSVADGFWSTRGLAWAHRP